MMAPSSVSLPLFAPFALVALWKPTFLAAACPDEPLVPHSTTSDSTSDGKAISLIQVTSNAVMDRSLEEAIAALPSSYYMGHLTYKAMRDIRKAKETDEKITRDDEQTAREIAEFRESAQWDADVEDIATGTFDAEAELNSNALAEDSRPEYEEGSNPKEFLAKNESLDWKASLSEHALPEHKEASNKITSSNEFLGKNESLGGKTSSMRIPDFEWPEEDEQQSQKDESVDGEPSVSLSDFEWPEEVEDKQFSTQQESLDGKTLDGKTSASLSEISETNIRSINKANTRRQSAYDALKELRHVQNRQLQGEVMDSLKSRAHAAERAGKRGTAFYSTAKKSDSLPVDSLPVQSFGRTHLEAKVTKFRARLGADVICKSPSGVKRLATVVAQVNDHVKVHYDGFHARYDEWISLWSDRMTKAGFGEIEELQE